MRSDSIGADLPARFRVGAYDQLNQRVAVSMTTGHPAWHQWAAAFNGIGYRLAGSDRANASLRVALAKSDRTRQELNLFAFVSSVCSAIECYAYAACCAGAMLDATAFPIATEADRRKVTLKAVSAMFAARFTTAEPMHLFLERVVVDPSWRELVDWRDVAIHRGAVPQAHFLATSGPTTPSQWTVSVHRGSSPELVPSLTQDKLNWLIDELNTGIEELHDLLDRHGVPPAP